MTSRLVLLGDTHGGTAGGHGGTAGGTPSGGGPVAGDGLGSAPWDLRQRAYVEVLRPGFGEDELADESAVAPVAGRSLACLVEDGPAPAVEPGSSAPPATGARATSRPVAVAVWESFPAQRLAVLTYLAVRPDARGGGSGTLLLQALRRHWHGSGACDLVLAEVHDPRHWPREGDRATDRLRFYERAGCHLLAHAALPPDAAPPPHAVAPPVTGPAAPPVEPTPIGWTAPRIHPDRRRLSGYLLLAVHGATPGDTLDPDRLASWLQAYYARTEGAPATDPEYLRLRRELARTPAVVCALTPDVRRA